MTLSRSQAEDVRAVARKVVAVADPHEKATAARTAFAAWNAGDLGFEPQETAHLPPLERLPGRLDRPQLLEPAKMPKRGTTGRQGRAALLHSLAHIELNAINLAWDMVGRFASTVASRDFVTDWAQVGDDEARHFQLLAARLEDLGTRYGDLPAHDGLWDAADSTRDNVLARLAVVPMVLEARGLDVCPVMIERLDAAGDQESASILRVIYEDEISHVRVGLNWLEQMCAARGLVLRETWQSLVKKHFKGRLKRPFNTAARAAAGFPRDFYEPLADGMSGGEFRS